jgi:hypothetical protein
MNDIIESRPIAQAPAASSREIQSILNALRGIRSGSVEIFVQDSRIIQIERLEKRRLV